MNSDRIGKELLDLMQATNAEEIRIHATQYFAGLTGSKDGQCFIDELKYPWANYLYEYCDDPLLEVSKNCLITIVNLSAEPDFCSKMLSDNKLVVKLLTVISESKLNGERVELTSKALSNLAQKETNANIICGYLGDELVTFYKALDLFYNPSINLQYFANFLSNITQVKKGRKFLVEPTKNHLSKLLVFISHSEEPIRQIGIVSAIRNCIFDIENHEWFLGPEVDILPHLLLPLAGPEEFDDEDNESLPPDLQYLEPTKKRDPNPLIRKMLIESISQLCCTKSGRSYVKSKNAYIIMRELHKWEKDEICEVALENLIQLLISDEPSDPNLADLHKVELPKDGNN